MVDIMTDIRIGIVDIETAPFESLTWGIWDQNIGLNQIQKETSILSYAWKWLGSKQVIYEDTSGHGPKSVRDDRKLLASLWTLLDAADIVVAQNGVAFDVKRINSRMVMEGLPPYSPIRIIDTKLVAKKHFAFSSNRLEWLGKYLAGQTKYKHSKFEGMELWVECLKDNPEAWKEMKKYNIIDTQVCEKVYLALRPWMDQHPNLGAYTSDSTTICPKCGSKHLQARGTRYLQQGAYQRYQCQKCRGWSRGKVMLLPLAKRRSMLA
jgi:RNase_H superfamily